MISSKSAKAMIAAAAKMNKIKAKKDVNYAKKQIHRIFKVKNGNSKGFGN